MKTKFKEFELSIDDGIATVICSTENWSKNIAVSASLVENDTSCIEDLQFDTSHISQEDYDAARAYFKNELKKIKYVVYETADFSENVDRDLYLFFGPRKRTYTQALKFAERLTDECDNSPHATNPHDFTVATLNDFLELISENKLSYRTRGF